MLKSCGLLLYIRLKSLGKGGLVGEVAEEGGEVGVGGNAHFFA